MEDNRNFILAIVLTMIILFGWEYFFNTSPPNQELTAIEQVSAPSQTTGIPNMSSTSNGGTIPGMAAPVVKEVAADRSSVIDRRQNVIINSERLSGSISLKGLRFDDLCLTDYHETVDPTSDIVTLLNPSDAFGTYFADFGWIGDGKKTGCGFVMVRQ